MHSMDHTLQTIFQFIFLYAYPYESEGKHVWLFSCPPLEPLTGSPRAQVEPRARAYLRAVEVHESEILWKLQEGGQGGQGGRAGGGGISQGGAAVPARLTPPWLCGARLGLLEERRLRAPQTCIKAANGCQHTPERSVCVRLHNNSIHCVRSIINWLLNKEQIAMYVLFQINLDLIWPNG